MESMGEASIDTNAGKRRRLPTWMLSNSNSILEKSENLDKLCSTLGELNDIQDASSMVESTSEKRDVIRLAQRAKASECKGISSENHSNENNGKVSGGESLNDSKSKYGRTKRKYRKKISGSEQPVVMASSSTEHMKLKRARDNDMKCFSQETNEDEVELTVQDLLSIAEECVHSDKHEESFTRDSQQKFEHTSSTAKESKLSGSLVSSQSLSRCIQSSSYDQTKVEQRVEKAAPSAYEFIGTGDAAQDMLKLFLGPLLQKSPSPRRLEPETTTELLTSAYQSDGLARSLVDVEDDLPLMKKKCSLKEKMAMFLN